MYYIIFTIIILNDDVLCPGPHTTREPLRGLPVARAARVLSQGGRGAHLFHLRQGGAAHAHAREGEASLV